MEFWLGILGHLLPRGQFFGLSAPRTLVKWLEGLAVWLAGLRADLDSVWSELLPSTTTRIADHEAQFGAGFVAATDAERRGNLAARWLLLRGGQGPDYLQEVLQRAGFPVWVHEFWDPTTFVVRDPHDYVVSVEIGRVQCDNAIAFCDHGLAQISEDEVSGGNYLVNKTLTSQPRPPLPTDPADWEGFIYIGGQTFPAAASIPEARRDEFEDLILQVLPMDKWAVILIGFTSPPSRILREDSGAILREDSGYILRE